MKKYLGIIKTKNSTYLLSFKAKDEYEADNIMQKEFSEWENASDFELYEVDNKFFKKEVNIHTHIVQSYK